MLAPKILAGCFLLAPLFAAPIVDGQGLSESERPSFESQSDGKAPKNLRSQPGNSETLEIAPQPSQDGPRPKVAEIPGGRTFKPSDDTSSLDRNFRPRQDDTAGQSPYLGIAVKYTTQCYLGMEERGLEVQSVHPDSPAAEAGLRGRTPVSVAGALGGAATTLLGPLNLMVSPLLERAGAFGQGGDLIVAADDKRIRKKSDLEQELRRLHPGDTLYLTVIRPLIGGAHRTMKLAVKVGNLHFPLTFKGAQGIDSFAY